MIQQRQYTTQNKPDFYASFSTEWVRWSTPFQNW